jgi:hypothetical protein
MKKLTLAIAGLMLATASFAAPCGKDKKDGACCKGNKQETTAKKSDCKEKSSCCKKSSSTATAKK